MKMKNRIGNRETILACVLAYLSLIASQLTALLAGQGIVKTGLPAAAGIAVSAVLYVLIEMFLLYFILKKFLKLSFYECRIVPQVTIKPVWGLAAVILPVLVIFMAALTPGRWSVTGMNAGELCYTIVDAAAFYGLTVGIVEEAVFRGVIMTAIERRWNKYAAVLIPSLIFAMSHAIGAELDAAGMIQLVAAGSLVGILFSLVTYESGSVWNSALIHAVWNFLIVGGIFNIGTSGNDQFLFNYVLDSRNFAVTGGDFGIEASAFSVIGYAVFSAAALWMIMRERRARQRED